MKRLLLPGTLAALMFAPAAFATPARVGALSNNAGFIDDTDFLQYPSALGAQPTRALINYSGAFDGGFTIAGGGSTQALLVQRLTVGNSLGSAPGASPGYSVLYASGNEASGFLLRANHDAETLTLGGAWSNGPGKGEPTNLAIGGNVNIIGRLDGDPQLGLNVNLTRRALTSDRLTYWGAGVGLTTVTEQIFLEGGYTLGPRFRNDIARASFQLGPWINVETGETNAIQIDVPFANIAAEYDLRPWLTLRGSVVAAWVAQTDTDDLVGNLDWSVQPGGAFGVGFSHQRAQFDMTVNPGWALAGPAVLSGATNPMFTVLSARIDL